MSANGLEVFDKTIQTTHIWLNEITEVIGPHRQLAWKVLSTVLHKLRDRLPVEVAAHLGAQLPLLVRGVYYDQFQPAKQPTRCRDEAPPLRPVEGHLVACHWAEEIKAGTLQPSAAARSGVASAAPAFDHSTG